LGLELHIAGPGLDLVRRLEEGEPELILGRDAECDVCLPDPQRNVSRRHLALRLQGGELHFHVMSVVNGIEMPFGEAPPGARGVLPMGQTLRVAEYSVSAVPAITEVKAQPAASPEDDDPWAALDRQSAPVAPAHDPRNDDPTGGFGKTVVMAAEDDPFGDWGFESTFGPGGTGGGAVDANTLGPASVPSFFRGLGLDANSLGQLTEGELESMGRLVRTLVLGVLDLHANAVGVKKDLRAEDRTMLAVKDNNPLKTDWPQETKMRYLFGGRAAAKGFISAERAVRELLVDLVAHNSASGAATRAAMEATLREFEPETLKLRLLGGGTKLFEGTRAWDAYTREYEEQAKDLNAWAARLLSKHFTETYLRESLRIRRETPPRKS
jgi:predicted component of type VI protein secretion system